MYRWTFPGIFVRVSVDNGCSDTTGGLTLPVVNIAVRVASVVELFWPIILSPFVYQGARRQGSKTAVDQGQTAIT
jgi:hypothetical protein